MRISEKVAYIRGLVDGLNPKDDDTAKIIKAMIDVLEDMAEFVTKYPSEFLIVSIKEDAESKNSIRQFDDLLKDTI